MENETGCYILQKARPTNIPKEDRQWFAEARSHQLPRARCSHSLPAPCSVTYWESRIIHVRVLTLWKLATATIEK